MADNERDGQQYRSCGLWRDRTVVDDLLALARDAPDRTALVNCYWSQPGRAPVAFTYQELAARVDRLAAGLVGLGVTPGDRVAMQFTNSWQATVTTLACARIGAVIMPIFVGTGAGEVLHLLRLAEATVLCCTVSHADTPVAAPVAAARDSLPALRHLVVDGDEIADGALSFGGLADRPVGPDIDLDAYRPQADDPFQIMYTSGTSGTPKGVLHTHNTLYAATRAFTVPMRLGPEDVLVTPMAVGGQAGFLYGLMAPLIVGGATVWGDRFRAPEMLDSMAGYGVTAMYSLPMLVEELAEEQRKRPRSLSLRRLVAGSAPIPPSLPVEVRETFGVSLHPLWGMTENGGVTIGRADDAWDEATRSDGLPVDGMRVRIVGEDGVPVAPGTAGSLEIRGANQCVGYYRADELYAAQLHDGWFVTGDLATSDERGAVKIVGRLMDEINREGVHVPTDAVEDVLRSCPEVRDVALIGEPDQTLGQRIVAFVVRAEISRPGPDLASLGECVLAAGLSATYRPDRVVFLDELPRNPAGKVLRRALRDRLGDG